MVEREEGNPFKKDPETVAEVSGRLREIFQNVKREHPDELFIWQSALYDIIDQAQMQYNIRIFKADSLHRKNPEAEDKFHEESKSLSFKDNIVLEKMEKDARYDRSYSSISKELLAMQTAFVRSGTQNHLGATIRELRRVKRSIQEL